MKTGKALSNIGENAEQRTAWRIANEFQTPLGVIISAGELLESYFERLTSDRRRLALEDILCAARQMNQTLDSLAAVGKERKENRKLQCSSRCEEAPYSSATMVSDKLEPPHVGCYPTRKVRCAQET